jgi:hypothetical protein
MPSVITDKSGNVVVGGDVLLDAGQTVRIDGVDALGGGTSSQDTISDDAAARLALEGLPFCTLVEQRDTRDVYFLEDATHPELEESWTRLPCVETVGKLIPAVKTAIPQFGKNSDTTTENICGPVALLAGHYYHITVTAKLVGNGGGHFVQLLAGNGWNDGSGHFKADKDGNPSTSAIDTVDTTGVCGFFGTAGFTYYLSIDAILQVGGANDVLNLAYAQITEEPDGSYISNVVMTVQDRHRS